MLANPAASLDQGHRHAAQSVCEHCGGLVWHEPWCITCDALVQYAYGVVLEPEKLTLHDRLILHGVGASWTRNASSGACQDSQKKSGHR
jgi:hypothetical protein